MRTIKMTTGARVPLDGDLLTMLETLYHELTAKRELERTFEDTVREIQTAIEQMTDTERRQYLAGNHESSRFRRSSGRRRRWRRGNLGRGNLGRGSNRR